MKNNTKMVNLPIEYSSKPVTPFGGMSLMKRFIDLVGIREKLESLNLTQTGSNRGYDPKQIVENFWLGIWTGASRYIHCDWLRYDQVLHSIFGWDAMPSQSTYSRFFSKFSQSLNNEIFPELQHWFFNPLNIGSITVDFDNTVITRYGEQEGSAKGYNPNKRGRNSHHPLMAFVEQTRSWQMPSYGRVIRQPPAVVKSLWKKRSIKSSKTRKSAWYVQTVGFILKS